MPSTPSTKALSASDIREFQATVYDYYHAHGRPFPWRDVTNPYDILVSEIMLQQTQAERVVPKYQAFIQRFPTAAELAAAPLADVLVLWSGLGYNRRAIMLHRAAQAVVNLGEFPTTLAGLQALSGVGPYTAAAVMAFAYDQPVVVNETNIRSVYIHHFCGDREGVKDSELEPLIEATVDREHPREWYQALMDYGAMLKKAGINPSRRSAHYVRQAPLKGSSREARGAVLRHLHGQSATISQLATRSGLAQARIKAAITALESEGFITRRGRSVRIA